MIVTGRPLTAKEAFSVKHPYSKNKGEPWNIEKIANYMEIGANAIQGTEQENAIKQGLKALADE